MSVAPELVDVPLPFSPAKQDALVGYLLSDDKLFMQARELISPNILVDPWCQKLWAAALEFADLWKRPPKEMELRESSSLTALEQGARNKIFAKMAKCKNDTQLIGLDVLKLELDNWLQGAIYRKAVETSAVHYNKGRFKEAYEEIRAMNRNIDSVSFTGSQAVDFSNSIGFLNQRREDMGRALTFGVKAVDRCLLPEGTAGSLLPGDMTCMLAPTNVGKTTCLVTTARHNLVKGKSVLFLSHEGSPADIQEKLWRCMLAVGRREFYALQNTPEGQKRLANAQRYLTRYLTYMPLHRPSLTVEEVESIIRREQEKRISRYGKGYDLVVDDYPAKLLTVQNSKGNLQRRQKDEFVYDYLCRLASEMNFHCLAAIQSNREASKINRGQSKSEDQRLLNHEDVSESFGTMQAVTNVISINRDDAAIQNKRVTYYISKSRSSETGWAICCKADYDCAMTHGDELGATWYRGSGTMSDQIDELLNQHLNQAIPEHLWSGF